MRHLLRTLAPPEVADEIDLPDRGSGPPARAGMWGVANPVTTESTLAMVALAAA
jgi:hypothetical protein